MPRNENRKLASLLLSADRAPFKGRSPHAIEDGVSVDDAVFLNETIRESQAQISAGQGFVPAKDYFEAKRVVLRAAMAGKLKAGE